MLVVVGDILCKIVLTISYFLTLHIQVKAVSLRTYDFSLINVYFL